MRVWVSGEDHEADDVGDLRGVVETIATGKSDPFRSADELAGILRARTGRSG